MNILTFDIETIPCDDVETIAEIAKGIKPPGTIKLPASIAKWHEENGADALLDAVARTSLDGLYGRIACISWQFNDGDVNSVSNDGDERKMLEVFYGAIVAGSSFGSHSIHNESSTVFCGHNIAGFDLPFLKARSIILGIKPPAVLLKAMNAKPWDACIADTMTMWNSDSQKRASMDKLCKAFGIAGKGDMDGSMVAETWETDPKKVISYCEDDIRRTRAMYKRITFS
jgi:predicted PolB exonuclease-like 3'-5' exonuclease